MTRDPAPRATGNRRTARVDPGGTSASPSPAPRTSPSAQAAAREEGTRPGPAEADPVTPRRPSPSEPAGHGPGSEFVRVGLAGSRGRTDLAVPAGVPLARLLPTLLRHTGEDPWPDGGTRHGGWVVRRADGTRLAASRTLAGQGVVEGDLLFLTPREQDDTPPLYDDVVELVGEHGVPHAWPSTATRVAAAGCATAAVLAVCVALLGGSGSLPGWLGLAVAVTALGVAVLTARGLGDVHAATLTGVLAAPPAVLGALLLLGGEFGAGHALLACAVTTTVGALGPILVGGGDGAFATLVTGGLLAGVGAVVSAGWDAEPARAAAVAAPLALALTTLWPVIALRVARVPPPQVAGTSDDLERLPSQLAHDQLAARVAQARLLLLGMLTGSHLVAVGGTVLLFASGSLWADLLGWVLTLLMLLRARLFRTSVQVAVPLAAAVLTALAGTVTTVAARTGENGQLLGAVLPGALLVAAVAGGVALSAGRVRLNPRASRALDLLEVLLLASVVPLALAVWEVYTTLLNLRA